LVLLIHTTEISSKKVCISVLLIVPLGKLSCAMKRKGFEPGSKNRLNRTYLCGTKF
jgi:hypothetical protein